MSEPTIDAKTSDPQAGHALVGTSDDALLKRGICPVCLTEFGGDMPASCPSCGSELPPDLDVQRFSPPDVRHWATFAVGLALVVVGLATLGGAVFGAWFLSSALFPGLEFAAMVLVNVAFYGTLFAMIAAGAKVMSWTDRPAEALPEERPPERLESDATTVDEERLAGP